MRALRLADGALTNGPRTDLAAVEPYRGAVNVPASRFLRQWSPRIAAYNALHQRRIRAEMTRAAKAARHYHLS